MIKDNNASQEASLGIKELIIWDRLAEEITQKWILIHNLA